MKSKILLSMLLTVAMVENCPIALAAHSGGGGHGGGAPAGGGSHGGGGHGGGAPAGGGSHGGGAPRMEAPHASAPRMEAPHASAPRMEAPRASAPRMEAPRAAAPRMEAPRVSEGGRSAGREEPGRVPARSFAGARNPERTESGPSKFGEAPRHEIGMGLTGASSAHVAGMNPGRVATEYRAMNPGQRNELMSHLDPQKRAETMSHMNDTQRAEAMYKMTPEQRSETLARMNPAVRNSLLAPSARMNERGGMLRAAGAAAATVGAASAIHALGSRGEPGAHEMASRGEHLSSRLGAPLHYRADARDMPRAGDARNGREGALDPGGFLRKAGPSAVVNPAYARAQFAQHMPNFAAIAARNQANLVASSNWSWQLPAYAPGWFGGGQGPWSWNNNWWNGNNYGWWNGPGFWNGYNGRLPWWLRVMSLWPWGLNSGLGWSPYLNCYSAYYWNGDNYPIDYYAVNGYVPTQYVFSVPNGQFWNVGSGYSHYLPGGYHAPITVAVKESVPQYSTFGQIVGYKFQTFYYNAFWDQQAQAYGYYDYRQQYHLVNLPGLNTYSRTSPYAVPQYGSSQYAAPPQPNAPPQYGPSQYVVPQSQPQYGPSQYVAPQSQPQYGQSQPQYGPGQYPAPQPQYGGPPNQ